jgi:hypothetical protein
MSMDMGLKLEHLLRQLKNAEPAIEHWQEFGEVGRSAEIDGVLANAGALNRDERHMADGLVVAVQLLAKTCAALSGRITALENTSSRGDGAQSRRPEARE